MQSKKRIEKRFLIVSLMLAFCGFASWRGLVAARDSGDREWTLIFACACVSLLFATVQSIALPLVRQIQNGSDRKSSLRMRNGKTERGEYIATFSIQDRVVAVLLAGAFALITAYLCLHPTPLLMRILSSGILLALVLVAYRINFTAVRFTNQQITVRLLPFGPYSELYTNVASVQAQPGNLHIRFSDGRRLNLWSGLGDSTTVRAILEKQVDVLPSVARWAR
jgi:hypothetical protein